MNPLEIPVPRFANYLNTTNPALIPVGQFFNDATYRNEADEIAEMSDKEDRDRAKAKLPCIMGACYADSRSTDAATAPTGLMLPEFDAKGNPGIIDWPDFAVNKLPQLPYVVYSGLSISRQGAFALFAIPTTGSYQSYYKAITEDFERCGYNVDQKVGFAKALRGYAYNDSTTSFQNPNAKIYTRQVEALQRIPVPAATGKDAEKVQAYVSRIMAGKLNVTNGYDAWTRIAQALAIAFGESGRAWFDQLSSIHPEYDAEKTDRKYSSFLNKGYSRVGLGTFYHLCDRFESIAH